MKTKEEPDFIRVIHENINKRIEQGKKLAFQESSTKLKELQKDMGADAESTIYSFQEWLEEKQKKAGV